MFNWMYAYWDEPRAAGTLFIFDQEYLGPTSFLSSSAPGFIAQSQGVTDNRYVFDPNVTLNGNTQYFLYSDTSQGLRGGYDDPYAGGIGYVDSGGFWWTGFNRRPDDYAFQLEGTVIPEPSSLLIWSLIGLSSAGIGWRRRRKA
ncbi:MAG: PEP-CTERM sorting domain-containing protein [Planctomycetota bacterium]